MWLPLDGLVVGVQVGATEAIIVLKETWRERTAMGPGLWAPGPPTPPTSPTPPPSHLESLSRPAMYLVRVHLVGAKAASGPGRC